MNNSVDKLKQIKALKNGKGLQYLFDMAYTVFGNPIFMHDLDYKLLAHTENTVTDDNSWNELITNGVFSRETIEVLKNEGIMDTAASAKSVVYLTSDKRKYDRLFGKVFDKNNVLVGAADILACYKPIEDDDCIAFEAFCEIVSREISKSESYQTYGSIYQETLIGKLVNGAIEDKGLFTVHVDGIYTGLKTHLYLAVVDISQCGPKHDEFSYFKALLKKTQPAFKYYIYLNYILIIISTDEMMLDVEKDLYKLNRLFQNNNIYAGISSSFENLFELQKYYNEALSSLNSGVKISKQRIFLYEQFKE